MAHFVKAMQIDVLVPIAYQQWMQSEQLPHFIESVDEVRWLDDKHLHWRGTLNGKPFESDIEITGQVENELIAWKNPEIPENQGTLRFTALGEGCTLLTVDIEYAVESPEVKAAEALGMIAAQIEDSLESFKAFVEARTQSNTENRRQPGPDSVSPG
jgi:uncharacterized membrane protein